MPLPIILFAAAGALAGTGLGAGAGGVYLWRRASQEASAEESSRDVALVGQLLKEHTELAELRNAAIESGVDVEAVIAGYRALKQGHVDIIDVVQQYYAGRAPVPASHASSVATQEIGPADEASPAQIRSWARDSGMQIADRGPIPRAIVDAYRDAHAHP